MDSSKVHLGDASFAGSFKYTPFQQLRELFVAFIQGLFEAAPPGAFHWEPDPATSEIIVQDEAPVREEMMQKRPLVTLTRAPVQFYSLGMDDLLEYQADIGRKTKSVLVPGTVVINCCSRNKLEAEQIAWIIAEHLWLLRDMLMKQGMFDVGRSIGIGSPTGAGTIIADDDGDTWTMVPVSVPYQFARTSEFTPLGQQVLRSIEARVRTRGAVGHVSVGPLPAGTPDVSRTDYTGPPPVYGESTTAEDGLTKDRHPLDPSREVNVRVVRPFGPGGPR